MLLVREHANQTRLSNILLLPAQTSGINQIYEQMLQIAAVKA
jgi:hypothetical protein